ncbi:VanZ family protein [Clostridium sp. DL1XJH146]
MSNNIKCLIDFVVLGLIYYILFFKGWKSKGKDKLFINTLMFVYVSFVMYYTLMPIIVSLPFIFNHPYVPMNMHLFVDYFYNIRGSERQILLNIIMMMPFGFLFPIVKKKKLWSCALYTFLFSLGIEIIQPLLSGSRVSDITDLVTNTVGGILGYVVYMIFKPLVEAIINNLKLKTAN